MKTTNTIKSLDLNLLRILVALVEDPSTVRVAQRLLLSQPTVSGALARLRMVFGDELLARNGRDLEPTARALELMQSIKPHLDGLSAAISAAVPFDPAVDRRTFRFGCTDAVALAVLPQLSQMLNTEAPQCDLVVRVGDYLALPGKLARGEISLALGYLRHDPAENTKVKVLRHSPWVVIRDASTPKITGIDDFCARAHAIVTPLGDLTGFVDDALVALGKERHVVFGGTSFALLLSVLPGSNIVATVPDFVAKPLAALGNLSIDPLPIEIPPVKNTLAWRVVLDRVPAECWFRNKVTAIFAP